MKTKFPLGEAPIAAVLFAAFFAKFYFDNQQALFVRQTPRVTRATAEFQAQSLRRFHFGFKNVIADTLWVQLLQEASHQQLGRDEVSWEFAQLNAITALDPKFSRAYTFGTSFLSVFRRDRLGAQLILERWARVEPANWRAHYLLGYHYFFEQKKFQEASKSILRAAAFANSPPWLSSLGVRLLSQTGAHFSAMQIAVELYPSLSNLEAKDRLRKRIRSLRFKLLKTAWEKALEKYPKQQGRQPAATQDITPLVKEELSDLGAALGQLNIHEDLYDIFQERFQFFYNTSTHKIDFAREFAPDEMTEIEESGINPEPSK